MSWLARPKERVVSKMYRPFIEYPHKSADKVTKGRLNILSRWYFPTHMAAMETQIMVKYPKVDAINSSSSITQYVLRRSFLKYHCNYRLDVPYFREFIITRY